MNGVIQEAVTEEEIRRCFPVMSELRPELDEETFLRAVTYQREHEHYRLVYIELDGAPACVAGFRITHNLSALRHLYVDDLVTAASRRRRGLAKTMLDWLEAEARRLECRSLQLDSGVQRHTAHRLYIGAGLDIVFYHFRKVFTP
jgi:GNAT superfamily N-acetyltransferase